MKNQSRTIKTNPELQRVVMGSSGGHRRLPRGSDDFSLQTDTQTLHHNIYIIIIISPQSQLVIISSIIVTFLAFSDCHFTCLCLIIIAIIVSVDNLPVATMPCRLPSRNGPQCGFLCLHHSSTLSYQVYTYHSGINIDVIGPL